MKITRILRYIFIIIPLVFVVSSLRSKEVYQFLFKGVEIISGNPSTEEVIPEVKDGVFLDIDQNSIPIFFVKIHRKPGIYRTELVRVIRKTDGTLRSKIQTVLKSLILGPMQNETRKGLFTTLPSDLKVNKKFMLKNGVLHISFNDSLLSGSGSEILKHRLHQIKRSLTEIEEIQDVKIYINYKDLDSLLSSKVIAQN